MYFVYIVKCSDESFYVGCTNNLEKRIKQHNESKWGAHYTKIRRPVELKYSETFKNLKDARKREREIKGWRREKKLNLMSKYMLLNPEFVEGLSQVTETQHYDSTTETQKRR